MKAAGLVKGRYLVGPYTRASPSPARAKMLEKTGRPLRQERARAHTHTHTHTHVRVRAHTHVSEITTTNRNRYRPQPAKQPSVAPKSERAARSAGVRGWW